MAPLRRCQSAAAAAGQYRGIDFTIEQHAERRFACWRALGSRRIPVLGDVRVLEGDALHLGEVHAIVVGEHAADPGNGRYRTGADGDSLSFEIFRS